MSRTKFYRRDFFKISAAGLSGMMASQALSIKNSEASTQKNYREIIREKVYTTPFIDTHEHLPDEKDRLTGMNIKCNDWTFIFSHYLDSDMRSAGMTEQEYNNFFSPEINPVDKWKILEPYWQFIKNTGYGQAVQIACKKLYNVDEVSEKTIHKIQSGYQNLIKRGFYKKILKDLANIESCQVNARPYLKSEMPDFLMPDINLGMMIYPGGDELSNQAGITVKTLSDWHKVMEWWFNTYGKYSVGVKVANAYSRNIDFEQVEAKDVEQTFLKHRTGQKTEWEELKRLQDHLFWYGVELATKQKLPVKLHTGYYAQWAGKKDQMPLERVAKNPKAACDLCAASPETTFVFFHICYPYYEEMLALAKQYANAYIDMCWSWIINPVSSKEFLKKFLVIVPANKIFTFGGDYTPVEPVLGHATMARDGIVLALTELVDEQLISINDALDLTDIIMHGNARRVFNLETKYKILKNLDWGKVN